jgi:hypothetical protein
MPTTVLPRKGLSLKWQTRGYRSRRQKKLCLTDRSNANGYNKGGSSESTPVSNTKQKNGKVEKSGKEKNGIKHGLHGDVLEKFFDDGAKPSADKGEANEAESESSAGNK